MHSFGLLQIALTLFLIMDAFGNVPFYLALLKDFPERRRRRIILREMLIALAVIFIFAYLGNTFLNFIHVNPAAVGMTGGLILFIISLQLIFPKKAEEPKPKALLEPFVVPLAVPLVAGPGILGSVMVYAAQLNSMNTLSLAILLAWVPSLIVLLSSTLLQRLLGKNILMGIERLMGFVMTLFAVNLFLDGLRSYIQN